MATEGTHREKTEKNRRFLGTLDEREFPEWFATVAFYTGLQFVEMLMARSGTHFKGHTSRHRFLKSKEPELWKNYRPLYNLSVVARYHTARIKPAHVKVVRRHLDRLTKQIAVRSN